MHARSERHPPLPGVSLSACLVLPRNSSSLPSRYRTLRTQCSDINGEVSFTYQPHGSRRLVDEQGRKQHKKIEDRKAEQIARGAIAPLIPDPQGKQQKPCACRRCSHPRSEEHTSELQSLMR